jgi:Carboxypeptidase regulatory-like domain
MTNLTGKHFEAVHRLLSTERNSSMSMRHIFLVGLMLAAFSSGAFAQSNATLQGTVTDQSGAVVAGAKVTVRNLATSFERITQTDSGGNYQVAALPPGSYQLKAELNGFKTFVQTSLTLEVDQNARLDIALQVGAASETVTVTSDAPLVRTTDTTVGGVVENRRIMEMPLNGRFFLDLANLLPGTVSSTNPRTFLASGTAAGAFGINTGGSREDQVNYLVEGINLNDMVQNQLTFQPNIEFIQEFKIQVSSFSAELGRSSGAVINAVMRSGKNTLHGDAYEFLRNDALDARNFFDPPRPVAKAQTGRELPPFKRNIFGAAVGGPIRFPGIYNGSDRTFFFATYEGRRQRESETLRARVPTAAERASITNPLVQKLVALLPAENAAGNFNFVGSASRPRTLDQVTGKVDHQLTTNDHLAVTYIFQRDSRVEPSNIGVHNIPGHGDFRPARRQFASFNETHTFGPRAINEFRAGFNRVRISFVGLTDVDAAAVGLNTGESGPGTLPEITVPGLVTFGIPQGFPQGRGDSTFQFSDTFTLSRSAHTFKFGAESRYVQNNNFNSGTKGLITFVDMPSFLAGRVRRFTKPTGDISPALRVWAFNGFAQDDWKVRRNFTLNLGLRYEFSGVPSETHDRLVAFDQATASLRQVGTSGLDQVYDSDRNNFGPRIGFAWDPTGKGKTAIRSAYGIFFDQPVTNIVTPLGANPPFRNTVDFDNVTVDTLLGAAGTPRPPAVINSINRDFTSDYVQQWNLNVQHEIFKNTRLEVSYIGSKGTHLRLLRDINARIPSAAGTGARPFTAFGRINQNENSGSSNYNALWATFERRVSRGLLFSFNYAWSKSIDFNSVGSSNPQIQNPFDLRAERAVSDFDARHRFSYSFVYELPFKLESAPAVARRLATGWQLTGVGVLQSGSPMSPIVTTDNSGTGDLFDRPNLVGDPYAPGPNCPETRTPTCWFNPAAFAVPARGQFGNVGRNFLIGPKLNNFDFGLYKNNRVSERFNVQFRAQIYNLFNHPNFGSPTLSFAAPTATNPNPSNFGVVRATRAPRGDASSSRQIEFGLKLYF